MLSGDAGCQQDFGLNCKRVLNIVTVIRRLDKFVINDEVEQWDELQAHLYIYAFELLIIGFWTWIYNTKFSIQSGWLTWTDFVG